MRRIAFSSGAMRSSAQPLAWRAMCSSSSSALSAVGVRERARERRGVALEHVVERRGR